MARTFTIQVRRSSGKIEDEVIRESDYVMVQKDSENIEPVEVLEIHETTFLAAKGSKFFKVDQSKALFRTEFL